MRIETCSFCSRPVYPSKGIQFIRNDARKFQFCRSKCHLNFKMKRNPRKLAWTQSYRKAHGKVMPMDGSLQFAARRNVPVRYNRELVATTLRAMQRVSEIKAKRERVFYRQRMAGNKQRQLEEDRKLVDENQHLLPPSEREVPPRADEMDTEMQMEEEEIEEMESDLDLELSDLEVEQEIRKRKTKPLTGKVAKKMMRTGGVE